MKEPSAERASTRVSRVIKAPCEAIYRACLDPAALAAWRAPDGMTGQVHVIEAWKSGRFRISLTHRDPPRSPGSKTTEDTDAFHGRFVELVPCGKIVEAIESQSSDPRFAGEMRITTSLADVGEGTEITILCEDIPAGVRPADNETGCTMSMRNLAGLLETK